MSDVKYVTSDNLKHFLDKLLEVVATSSSIASEQLTEGKSLDDLKGSDCWGKQFYVGSEGTIEGLPEGVTQFGLSVFRTGEGQTTQVLYSSDGQHIYYRVGDDESGTWSEWTTIYPSLKGDTGNPAGFGDIKATIDANIGVPEIDLVADGPDEAKNLTFNFKNLKGEKGDPAGFGTVEASVDDSIGVPEVELLQGGTDIRKDFTFNFKNLKGEPGTDAAFESVTATTDNQHLDQPTVDVTLGGTHGAQTVAFDLKGFMGPQGEQGLQGNPGIDAKITSATATADGTHLDEPTVNVVVSGETGNQTLAFDFKGLTGATGPKGDHGQGIELLGTYASEEELKAAHPTGTPGETFLVQGHLWLWKDDAWVDGGELQGPKGDEGKVGPQGDPGIDAKIVSATATADATHSESPTVTVDVGGETGAQTLTFDFKGLMGPQGDQGIQGDEGQVGPAGKDAVVISATATADATHLDQPTVTVVVGGDPGAQTLTFDFKGLMGPQGQTGETGPEGKFDEKEAFLAAHPKGSYWWTSETTDPNTAYGGTWERVKDRFVWAMGDSDTVGSTGGAKTVSLTTANLASHTHSVSSHTHGMNSHTHSISTHYHGLNSHTHSIGSHTHTLTAHTHTIKHTHDVKTQYGGSFITVNDTKYGTKVASGLGMGNQFSSFGTAFDPVAIQPETTNSGSAGGGSTGNNTSFTSGAATGNTASGGPTETGSATGKTASAGSGDTGSVGSGTAHENMPPYIAAYCWHRTA